MLSTEDDLIVHIPASSQFGSVMAMGACSQHRLVSSGAVISRASPTLSPCFALCTVRRHRLSELISHLPEKAKR